MCGIVGLVHENPEQLAPMTMAMRNALIHRGPDDSGMEVWPASGVGLGNTRLSIIDLSPAGHQPMSNEDGAIWIVYNGEVYNYARLKRRLEDRGHSFRSNSDTETIIHAYEEWGVDSLSMLRGMYAFGLWDAKAKQLLLARDRMGIKPLFYYWDERTFAFASEIKALLVLENINKEIERSALFDYLTYLYIPAPKTAYKYIRKLQPGHYLVFDGHSISTKCYWDVSLEQDDSIDEGMAIELVRERLADAVSSHSVSDVPVGVLLSGGLDSSTIVAHMAGTMSQPAQTYSIGFDVAEHGETRFARLVAQKFDTNHRERIVGREAVQSLLSRVVLLYDEPFADGSAIPTYSVAQLAREEVKVVLSGDGGDEVFAGYRWYDRWLQFQNLRAVPAFVRHGLMKPLGRIWPSNARGGRVKHFLEDMGNTPLGQYARQMELFSPTEKRKILGSDWRSEFKDYDDYWYFRQFWRSELDPITRMQYLDLKTYLPDDILTKVDRASMAVSLEVRPPLLDHLLVEAVFSVPAEIRFRNAEKKYLLKQAMNGVLPAEVLTRGKKGFSSPLTQWMGEEKEWVQEFIGRSPRIVQKDALEKSGRYSWGPKYWALLVLEQWARNERISNV